MIWLALLPVSLFGTLLAYLLAPVWVKYAKPLKGLCNNREYEAVEPRLTGWMRYLSTTDNSLLGDDGHKERWKDKPQREQMIDWIKRNPAYTFDWEVLAATVVASMFVRVWGNPNINNRANAVAGWYFCRVGKYWNFKAVIHLFGDIAFMPEFGWKLQEFAQCRPYDGEAMYVFSLRLTAFY